VPCEYSIKKSTLRSNLIRLGVILSVGFGGFSLLMWGQAENERESAQYQAEDNARKRLAAAAFLRLGPMQALAQCREQWHQQLSWPDFYPPQGFAWSRQGVDGYFLQGRDAFSLRHFRCEADGTVLRGKRYLRPGMTALPAERSVGTDTDMIELLVSELSKQPIREDLVALEMYLQPDSVIATRAWTGAEQLQSEHTPLGADFPSLMQKPAPDTAAQSAIAPLLTPAPHNWLLEPAAAFALLQTRLPAAAKILKLRLEADQIKITIEGPIPAFDNNPPAASGDMEYDEYGIPDRSWWYPREIHANECSVGEPLEKVKLEFNRKWQADTRYLWLIYDCKTGFTLKRPKFR
jgi:hypothetical protein